METHHVGTAGNADEDVDQNDDGQRHVIGGLVAHPERRATVPDGWVTGYGGVWSP
jgi:hypothetical protein